MEKSVEKLVKKIEQIPMLPSVSQRMMHVISNEDASIKDIARFIEKDQSLTLKIMKIANSAFYGSLSKVTSLENALIKLGLKEIKSIVLGISIRDFFSNPASGAFDRERFWKHAIVCSQIAKFLGFHYHHDGNDDSLFLLGLIHDMGKVVLDEYFHEEFIQIIEYIDLNETTFSKAEKEVMGTTHYQIAAKILKQWKFPDEIIMPVFYHHAPWYDKYYGANSIILYLSNILTKLTGYPCHQSESPIDPLVFSKSSEIQFINKSGFELDYGIINNFITHILEFMQDESDNVMALFSE